MVLVEDGERMQEAVMEMVINSEMAKLHCRMYHHEGDEGDEQNVVNKSKFVVECEDGDEHAKFAFGDLCVYHEYNRHYSNFIYPHHSSLFSEVCSNASPSLSRNAYFNPIMFWMVYLQALMMEVGYREGREFKARERGGRNAMYNIPRGHLMWIMHYMSLLLYSDFTEFQKEFKKLTRRVMERETKEEFWERNSFVAHWNRYLFESVFFFGTQMKTKDIFYCGISIPMLFNSMEQWIRCPLSTTSSFGVALRFAGNHKGKGILLVIKRANPDTFYFPLHLFSQFDYEEERFFCAQKLKIVDIRSPSPTSGKWVSCFPAVCAIRLMEMVLRGQLFMDYNERMARKMVQGMVGWMEAYEEGREYEERGDGNEHEHMDHQYCQMLFNHRVKQFTEMQGNQIFLNPSELHRLSPDLFGRVSQMLANKCIHNPPFKLCMDVIEIGIKGKQLQRFKEIEENVEMAIGDGEYQIEMDRLTLRFIVKMMRASNEFPDKCGLFLYLRHKSCSSSVNILYDIVCPEMLFEMVNKWNRFNQIGDYAGFPLFSNRTKKFLNADQLTLRLCIRVVE